MPAQMKTCRGDLPISVVIPAYQAELFLDEAIAGIRRQTVTVGEIVVIDDGSTDGTRDVARVHGVRLIERRNSGPASARTAGVRAASIPGSHNSMPMTIGGAINSSFNGQPTSATRESAFSLPTTNWYALGETSKSGLHLHQSYRSIKRVELDDRTVLVDRAEIGRHLPLGPFLLPSTLLIERRLLLEHPFDETIRSGGLYTFPEDTIGCCDSRATRTR